MAGIVVLAVLGLVVTRVIGLPESAWPAWR